MADGSRPVSAVDRVLAVLDAGLQHSSELAEGVGDLTRCVVCEREPRAEESEFCADCRAYLLGDRVDPLVRDFSSTYEAMTTLDEQVAAVVLNVIEFMQQLPPEVLELCAELDRVLVEGRSLGLSEEHCMAVIDEEVERCAARSNDPYELPRCVRQRLYHEAVACACVSRLHGVRCEYETRGMRR